MIKFIKPKNLNGTDLRAELNAAGVIISENPEAVVLDADGFLWLDISESDKTKAESIVKNHNGNVDYVEPTIEQKLAQVGLSLEELKAALA